jgi:hypothetical protein
MNPRVLVVSFAACAVISLAAFGAYGHDMGHPSAAHGRAAQSGAHAHHAGDPHMRMTELRPMRAGDEERARQIIATMRSALEKYRDYRVALAERYFIFLPTVPQPEYHFVNLRDSAREYERGVDYSRPGSLLYVKDGASRYRLIGGMFSAPLGAAPEQLDAIVPLSIAQWHAHVDICLPHGITLDDLLRGNIGQDRADLPGLLPVAANPSLRKFNQTFGIFADGRFGFTGKIADPAACEQAGGHFIPQAWGWMVHVYAFAGDDLKVAYGHKAP